MARGKPERGMTVDGMFYFRGLVENYLFIKIGFILIFNRDINFQNFLII